MKTVTVTLKRPEILARVEGITHITAESMQGVDEKTRSDLKDIAQDGRVGEVNELMNIAWGDLMHTISGYVKKEMSDDISVSNDYQVTNEYKVSLSLSETFNSSCADSVVRAMNNFMANRIMGGYYLLLDDSKFQHYENKAEHDLIDIKRYLASPSTFRRRCAPLF